MNGRPTMTAAEVQAWEQLAKSGRLRRYLKAEPNHGNGFISPQPRYERALARWAKEMRA